MKLKTKAENIYYYLLVLLLVNNWLGDLRVFIGLYQLFKPVVLACVILAMMALIIKEKYSPLELVIAILLIIVGAYTSHVTGSKWTLYSMCLIAFAKNINIDKAIMIVYKCMSIFILIAVTIFLVQCVFLPGTLDVLNDGTYIKYGMTFIGANEAARYWIFWVMLYVYTNMERRTSILLKIVIALTTILFYVCTLSDTLLIVIALLMMKYLRKWKWINYFVRKCAAYSFGVISCCCIFILKIQDTQLFKLIDKFSTGRFSLAVLGVNEYGLSIIGQQGLNFYGWVPAGENFSRRLVIDTAYYMIMIQYGIFYIILFSVLFYKSRKRLDYKSACCVIAYAVYAVAANTILSPTAIFPVIIAAKLSWKPKKEHEVVNEYVKTTKQCNKKWDMGIN